jgi:transposase-like protein
MVSKHRHYDPEFKKETVRLADESGKPVAEVARDLGIQAFKNSS